MGRWYSQIENKIFCKKLIKGGEYMSVNKVIILGRLGDNPELKNLPSGNAVTNMNVATTERWMKDGKKEEKTEWNRVVVFGKQAENSARYLSKGREVFVEGKLQTRSWEDKDGVKRYTTEIVASNVQFIGGNSDKNAALKQADNAASAGSEVKTDANFASDDIPF